MRLIPEIIDLEKRDDPDAQRSGQAPGFRHPPLARFVNVEGGDRRRLKQFQKIGNPLTRRGNGDGAFRGKANRENYFKQSGSIRNTRQYPES